MAIQVPHWAVVKISTALLYIHAYTFDTFLFSLDKPNPKLYEVNEIYNFDTWSDQAISFIEQKVKEPVYIVCNSVGGVAGLTTAVKRPDLVKGVVLINISLRLLHVRYNEDSILVYLLTVI